MNRLNDSAKVTFDERDAGAFDCHISPSAHCDPNVRRRESRRVVDSIPGHCDHGKFSQLFDPFMFLPGRDARFNLVDSQCLCDRLRSALVVAREHDHFQPHAVQFSQRSRGRLLYRIGHCQDSGGTVINGNEDHGLTFLLERWGLSFQSFESGDSVLAEESWSADKNSSRRSHGSYSATSG